MLFYGINTYKRTILSIRVVNLCILKVAGKLQFALSWTTGRFGRAVLQPLFRNRARGGPSLRLTEPVRLALLFFLYLLKTKRGIPARVFSFRKNKRRRIFIWSDAMYDVNYAKAPGNLGFVVCIQTLSKGVIDSTEWLYASAPCDKHFMVNLRSIVWSIK